MNVLDEVERDLIEHTARKAHEDAMRKEWNKFAKLCLKDSDYDTQTINFVLHTYRGWDLNAEASKLSYATTLLRYAHYITNY
jgi:hypothetical protein